MLLYEHVKGPLQTIKQQAAVIIQTVADNLKWLKTNTNNWEKNEVQDVQGSLRRSR